VLCFYHSIMDWHHPDFTAARLGDGSQRRGS
jgi:hypothetical protein